MLPPAFCIIEQLTLHITVWADDMNDSPHLPRVPNRHPRPTPQRLWAKGCSEQDGCGCNDGLIADVVWARAHDLVVLKESTVDRLGRRMPNCPEAECSGKVMGFSISTYAVPNMKLDSGMDIGEMGEKRFERGMLGLGHTSTGAGETYAESVHGQNIMS